MDSYIWTHQCWLPCKNLHSSTLSGHWMSSKGFDERTCHYIYIYIYTKRERTRERERLSNRERERRREWEKERVRERGPGREMRHGITDTSIKIKINKLGSISSLGDLCSFFTYNFWQGVCIPLSYNKIARYSDKMSCQWHVAMTNREENGEKPTFLN